MAHDAHGLPVDGGNLLKCSQSPTRAVSLLDLWLDKQKWSVIYAGCNLTKLESFEARNVLALPQTDANVQIVECVRQVLS